MTRVVTDGSADLPPGAAGVTVVRGPVRTGGGLWEGDPARFWAELGEGPELPATEAPSVEQLAGAYAGSEPVLAVHVSAELSRTVANARRAAAASPGPVRVVDSRSLGVGTGLVVMASREAVDAGVEGDRLGGMVAGWVDRLHVHALIDDVGFLVRAGRAGLVPSPAGRHAHRHLLAVNGHAIPIRELRHRGEAIRELIDHVREHAAGGGVTRWAVGHGDAADRDEFVERLTGLFGCDASYVTLLGAPVGVHLGPRALVLGFLSSG